jgi:hypothetical protein
MRLSLSPMRVASGPGLEESIPFIANLENSKSFREERNRNKELGALRRQ